jgi:DHA3 family macrolide efflux protein-like MFS transporter
VLFAFLILGLLAGLRLGGSLDNLASVRLRWTSLIFVGLFLRYGTQLAIEQGSDPADGLRIPLFGMGFLLLLLGLWRNREQPGFVLAFVGIGMNAIAVLTNGGAMPVWAPSAYAVGLTEADFGSVFHRVIQPLGPAVPGDFLTAAGPLGDIIPIPGPLPNVASIGDLFLGAGLAFFLFAATLRRPAEFEAAGEATLRRGDLLAFLRPRPRRTVLAETSAAVLVTPADLERSLGLGGATLSATGTLALPPAHVVTSPPFDLAERARRHPYVRLALDSSFSALWTGQLISMVGDRVHQVALAFLILGATGSPIAVGAVFLVATLPNLLFGPIAGTLVDRWDHREVMIVSDLLRAGLVVLIPIAAVLDLRLVYPLVFLVTTISIFFRPAKGAILPRMVPEEDLVPANSALWVGETFADIGGYVLAGLFVALLGPQLPLAFWVDSITYAASAVLIGSIAVAPLARGAAEGRRLALEDAEREAEDEAAGGGVRTGVRTGTARRDPGSRLGRLAADTREGWRFLRAEPVLLANTLQAAAGQFMLGVFLALTPVYAAGLDTTYGLDRTASYSFIEGAIGLGNLVGGFAIGLVGTRIALGRMVIGGYVATGATIAGLALTGNLALAVGLAFGAGVGNLAFVIPSQTLVQRRTPPELMGRVLGLRFSLVFGSMTVAMGIGGVLGEWFGAGPVIGVFGVVTVLAGLAGLLTPAVRDA